MTEEPARLQARLYQLDFCTLPRLQAAVDRDLGNVAVEWRPASLQDVTDVINELTAVPAPDRNPIIRRMREHLTLAERVRETVDDTSTLAAALDAEAELWSVIIDGAEKDQLDHVRTSYVPNWSNRHQSVLDRMADRRQRLRKDETAAKNLRRTLKRRAIPTDEESLRRAYKNHGPS